MSGSPIAAESLVAHRPKMKMVDEVLEIDGEHIVTSTRIADDWPGVVDGAADFASLIELTAQSVAALVGARDQKLGKPPGIGYLVGIKNAAFHTQSIPVQTPLLTRVTRVTDVGLYGVVRGRVEANGVLLAEMELQVFRPD
jgi:predicted hotdog family 3-hydroxylacyl-ACP dehydratase